jgi:hypothetical protein
MSNYSSPLPLVYPSRPAPYSCSLLAAPCSCGLLAPLAVHAGTGIVRADPTRYGGRGQTSLPTPGVMLPPRSLFMQFTRAVRCSCGGRARRQSGLRLRVRRPAPSRLPVHVVYPRSPLFMQGPGAPAKRPARARAAPPPPAPLFMWFTRTDRCSCRGRARRQSGLRVRRPAPSRLPGPGVDPRSPRFRRGRARRQSGLRFA